jgi:predicted nucleotidyltransferase
MNHRERIDACREVVDRLLRKYSDDIRAIAVLGSVARREDEEHSDVDLKVLVKGGSDLESHAFVLRNCLFSIEVRTEESWRRELTEPNSHLSLTVGSLTHVLPGHDPRGVFKRLSIMANALPAECWRNAVRDGLRAIVEDLGRAKNAYERSDFRTFRINAVGVALSMALVQANLGHVAVVTERELYYIFEDLLGKDSEPARAFRVASRVEDGDDDDVMDALNFLGDYLARESLRQSAMLQVHSSPKNYVPP